MGILGISKLKNCLWEGVEQDKLQCVSIKTSYFHRREREKINHVKFNEWISSIKIISNVVSYKINSGPYLIDAPECVDDVVVDGVVQLLEAGDRQKATRFANLKEHLVNVTKK